MLVFLQAIFLYRIVKVVRKPHTLDAHITSKRILLLRRFGIVLMVLGVVGSLAIFFVKTISLGIFSKPGDSGIAFFVTGIFVYLVSSVGLPGLLIFEASRLFGFEAKLADEHRQHAEPQKPAFNSAIKQPRRTT